MKKMILFIMIGVLLLCTALSYGETTDKKKCMMVKVQLYSEIDENTIKMSPTILVVEGNEAKIKLGEGKAELNDKKVK